MKKYLPKILMGLAPVVALTMYLIRGFTIYMEMTTYKEVSTPKLTVNVSFYELLTKENTLVLAKVLAIVSLCLIFVATVLFALSFFIKNKENILLKSYSILMLGSLLILGLATSSRFNEVTNGLAVTAKWYDFMTIPYVLTVAYMVFNIYLTFKPKKD